MVNVALNTSTTKRLQMLVMVFHVIALPLFVSLFFLCCAVQSLWTPLFIYIVFMFLDPRPSGGTVLSPFQTMSRNAWWWRQFANYFPITIHKTADLAPCFEILPSHEVSKARWTSWLLTWWKVLIWWYYLFTLRPVPLAKPTGKRYLFGYHPHGIIGMGALGGISTEGAGWSKLFPGIPVRLLTLQNNFYIPFYREYLLAMGTAMVSRSSCLNLLRNNNPICIVLGGARESLRAEPGRMDLILKSRYGFVKIALQTGASLVPIIAFGENDIYQQAKPDGIMGPVHQFMTKSFGFTIPLFHARGIFNYDMGILPYRKPINLVVGAPIDVPKVAKPTKEQVEKYHTLYVDALTNLFNDNRSTYWKDYENAQLNLLS